MQPILDYLELITNAKTVEELWGFHTEQMGSFGFDRLIYGFTRYKTTTSLGDPQDWVILTNQSSEYMEAFLDGGLVTHAPMVHWALENDGACSWRVINDMRHSNILTAEEREVLAFNEKMDVVAGYTISFRSVSERTKGAVALTARAGVTQAQVDAIWSKHGREIHIANNVMHLKFLTLPYSGQRQLTRRQREVLQWVGDGKTTQDIAILLGLTPATVEKHLRLAREALDVETTAQAVLKAAFFNQMLVVEGAEI